MRVLYVCGAGNSEGVRLALTINRHHPRWERLVILDDDASKHGRIILGVKVAGPFAMLEQADAGLDEVVNLVARTTKGRRAARQKLESYRIPFASLIHPSVDTFGAELADDVLVYENGIVSPEAVIGHGSVVFMGACVGHECRVGRCCVIAGNSVLNARVQLADEVYVGTNASILPEMTVGQGATIGAGSSVIQHVPAGATALGVPAQILVPSREGTVHPDGTIGIPDGRAEPGPAAGRTAVELEQTIAEIWQELLSRPRLNPSDNFFDLGGTSLLACQMRERVRESIDQALLLTDIFRFPTVRSLARHLASRANAHHVARSDQTRVEHRRDRRIRMKHAQRR